MRSTNSALVIFVLALLTLGLVMLASTSSVRAEALFDDPYHFTKRQIAFLVVAVAGGAALSRLDYHHWRRFAIPLGLLAIVMLALVFAPKIGTEVGGSRRWLRIGPIGVQPSEFAKLALVICMAAWMERVERRAASLKFGLVMPLVGLGSVLALLLLEPDFGTTLLSGAVGMLILYAGGARISHLVVTGVLGLCLFFLAVLRDPVRLGRIMAFLLPEKYPKTAYHLTQSKLAFIHGGFFGVGLGNSIQKQLYLPEAHTDFILAIIGEELGLMATLFVVLCFVGILVCGMMIAFRAPDTFGRLLAFGLTMMVVLQAAINIGVVTGCLPTKGLPLPFISYGGSSLVASVASIGILLSIGRQCRQDQDDVSRSIRDAGHSF